MFAADAELESAAAVAAHRSCQLPDLTVFGTSTLLDTNCRCLLPVQTTTDQLTGLSQEEALCCNGMGRYMRPVAVCWGPDSTGSLSRYYFLMHGPLRLGLLA